MARWRKGEASGERLVREALSLRRKIHGDRHRVVAQSLRGLGQILVSRGALAEADSVLMESLSVSQHAYAEGHFRQAEVLLTVGQLRFEQGRLSEAESLLRQALEIRTRYYGPAGSGVREVEMHLGRVLAARGRAEAEARRQLALGLKSMPPPPSEPAPSPHAGGVYESNEVDSPPRRLRWTGRICGGVPVLPPLAKGGEVSIALSFVVEPDGSLTEVTVLQSLSPAVDRACVDWFSLQRYRPGLKDGSPVRTHLLFHLTWRRGPD
jgi:hypothetical protein